MTGVPEANLAEAIFEGLTSLHPETLQPVPGAAERWTVNDDGTTYTFHLRRGLTWSDGTPLTAADFLASWRRALTPRTGSKYANIDDGVKHMQFVEAAVNSAKSDSQWVDL